MERRTEILQILRKRLDRAQERRMAAYKKFDEAVRVPSGIPHTCGALSVRVASREFKRALADVNKIMQQQHDLIMKDKIPEDLQNLDGPNVDGPNVDGQNFDGQNLDGNLQNGDGRVPPEKSPL